MRNCPPSRSESLFFIFLTKKTHLSLSAQIQDTKVKLLTKCKG